MIVLSLVSPADLAAQEHGRLTAGGNGYLDAVVSDIVPSAACCLGPIQLVHGDMKAAGEWSEPQRLNSSRQGTVNAGGCSQSTKHSII